MRTVGLIFVLTASGLFTVPAHGAEKVDLVVRGGTVVTMDPARNVHAPGAVAIRGELIIAIGPEADIVADYEGAKTIDARGGLIVPGLINAHNHAAMSLFRGLADDLALMEWLQKYIFPAEAKLVDEEFVRAGTRLACLEMLLGGTTTYVDMYYFENAVAEETAAAGMRGVLGQSLIDFPAPDYKTWDAALAGCEAFVVKWKTHPLVTPAVSPHAPYTVSPEHLQAAKALADKHGVPLVIHLSESAAEVKTIQERYQTTPIVHLDKLGVLGPNMVAAHVVHPTAEELLLLKKHDVGVSHNPQSNMKLASGIAPVPKMLELKIAVGLGTDGPASNNDLDLWEEIDTAAKLHKVATGDPTAISAREAFAMATIEGARAINRHDKIGSLEVGKLADVVVVSVDAPHLTPLYDAYSHLVYAVKASDVRTVVVHGKLLVEDRKPLTLDDDAILAKAREYREKILATLNK